MLKAVCKTWRFLPILGFSALLVFLMGKTTVAQNIDTTVNIKPSLTLDIPSNSITMNLDPATHDFDEQDLTITVGTNNRYGYKLYVSAANNNTDLVNVADSTKIIPNLTSSYSAANFPANNWGYRRSAGSSSSGNYGVFNVGNNLVSESSGPTNENAATLGFGAKIDYTKPSGLYELDLNFKAIPTVTQEYMQNLDPTTCIDEPTTVIDSRDEKVYTIRRLADGRCWMVENLRFTGELTDPAGTMTLNSATSNVSSTTTFTYGELDTSDSSATSYDDAKIHVGTIADGNTPIDPSPTAETNIPTVWYNFAAASAKTITGTPNAYESQYDICPKGWRLPDYGEAGGLAATLGSAAETFNPTHAGFYSGGSVHSNIGNEWWWTSTPATNTFHFQLANNNGLVIGSGGNGRTDGFSIRCILDEPIGGVTTMQQLASMSSADKTALKNSMTDSKIYTLRDTRDNQIYTVAKLKDGNLWMSENLNLGASTLNGNLTSSNTNLSTTVAKATFEGWKKTVSGATYTSPEYIFVSGMDSTSKTPHNILYNYCSATANTYCYASTSGTGNASYDICPSGWRMPTGGSTGELKTLSTKYNSIAVIRAPIFAGGAATTLTGCFGESGKVPYYLDTHGWYWSSTRYNAASMYDIHMSTSIIEADSYNSGRYYGVSVRCLLKP